MSPETRDALIAQQQMMQASLNEAIREVSESVWDQAQQDLYDVIVTSGRLVSRSPSPYRKVSP